MVPADENENRRPSALGGSGVVLSMPRANRMASASSKPMHAVDVLLTHSNHVFHDRKQMQKMQPYPPLQTLLAASVLREAGITVALCDVTLQDSRSRIRIHAENGRPASGRRL